MTQFSIRWILSLNRLSQNRGPVHSKAKWSLSNLASMLRLNLFTYRDLSAWLHNPFGTPPLLPDSQQLTLRLA
jgi:hypothetical protein